MSCYSANSGLQPANIKKFLVTSNYGTTLDLKGGVVDFRYYESVLDTTVRVSSTIVDTGGRYGMEGNTGSFEDDKVKKGKGDDQNLTGGEKVELEFEDNFGQTIKFNELRVKKLRDYLEDAKFTSYGIDLYSREAIDNELDKFRVQEVYEGKISDSVQKILKEVLKTKKTVDIDQTLNKFKFHGQVEKPFYKLMWLAKRSIPELSGAKGILAGYFFYETKDGFKFKSLDKLMQQSPVRKVIYNDSTLLPSGYDAKILDYHFDNTIDLQDKLTFGGYSQTKLTTLDPATQKYDDKDKFNAKDQEKPANMGGKEHPKIGADLNLQGETTRLVTKVKDTGTSPEGSTLQAQLKKAKELNFEMPDILRQSSTRYNQVFNFKLSISIPADFKIKAGDLVYCAFPENSWKTNMPISNTKSGLYMVIDVCHRLTPRESVTRLNLARESLYKK